MRTSLYLLTLLVVFTCTSFAEQKTDEKVHIVYERILRNSLIEAERIKDSSKKIPKAFNNEELYQLAIKLKRADWDLATYGDLGITYIESAFTFCLYELAKRDNGEVQLVALLKSKTLGWDAGHSLVLGDAIVKKGKPCLPHLRALPEDISHVARYIRLIQDGAKTNI